MIESKLIVPVKYNDGHAVRIDFFADLERQLVDAFGGVTYHTATGCWKKPRSTVFVREEVIIYTIAHPDDSTWTAAVLDFARSVKKDLTQDAVYVSIGGKVEFV